MTSTSSKPFHTYENVGYDDQVNGSSSHYATQTAIPTASNSIGTFNNNNNTNHNNNSSNNNSTIATTIATSVGSSNCATAAITENPIESPFPDPLSDSSGHQSASTARILSATDSTGNTRMLTSRAVLGQNLVTKLISLPSQSPMDSFREWSVSTFKCTKQLINEKRGICSTTNDAQLQADIEQLRETRGKLTQMLRTAYQMKNHYSQLVESQRNFHFLMNEMSMKCITSHQNNISNSSTNSNNAKSSKTSSSKQIIANFSSLSNNLSSTTTSSSPASNNHLQLQHHSHSDNLNDFLPILNHIKSSNISLGEDFKKNAMTLSATIKNGEKFLAALSFFCSNLATLVNKTIEDTLTTIKQFESARLEYDAERNSINFITPTAQTSMTYSSDKLELARIRYEQLKDDVQIKMKFLEENLVKVMHKQLLLFNSAFASYSTGNTISLESTLKQFSIR